MAHLREWVSRLAAVFGRREDDIDDELAFHRAMAEDRLRASGLSEDEARRQAALELGNASQLRESYREQRGLPVVDVLLQDVRYGARMLRRAPGFTVAATLTLALGIGANTAIFTVVDAVLLRPLPFADPDRLMAVGDRAPDGTPSNMGFTTVMDWGSRSRTFESFALMRSWQPTLVAQGEAERLPAVRVSWNYFEMIGVRPALGRTFTPDEDRPDQWRVILLSDGLWRRRFGADPTIVGRTVVMNDRPYRVVGVMPAAFEPLDAAKYYAKAEVWAPIGYDLSTPDACRGCRHLRAFGRLRAGVTVDQATAEMNTIREELRGAHPGAYEAGSIAVLPLRDAIVGDTRPALRVLLAAVAFVLLIACANVANLLIARSLVRQRELGLRAAIGASSARIVRQLLTESAMLSVLGGIAGVALARVAVEALATVAPASMPRLDNVGIDGRVLAFAVGVTMVTVVAFGLAPALWAARLDVRRTLSVDSRTTAGSRSRTRAALVVADLALALALLTGAGLMLRTIGVLTRADAGFESTNVLTMQFSLVGSAYAEDAAVLAFQERFLERARAVPGVHSVALAGQIPFGGNNDCRGFHANGRTQPNTSDDPCIELYGSSPDYLKVMRIPLKRGRFFDETDRASTPRVLVISEATARLVFGADDPLGAEVRLGDAHRGPWHTVIGVVGDVHHSDLTAPVTPAMYVPQSQHTDSYLAAVIRGDDPLRLAAPVREILRQLDVRVPVYEVATLEELLAKAVGQRVFVMRLLSAFAVTAVLLAAVGLYGVVAYTVTQRTREFGVRVALGAQRRHVVALVLFEGGLLAGAGILVGLAAAAGATRYLGALVYGVGRLDALTFSAAAALLFFTALLAHVVPVRRALRIDPMTALRHD